MPHIHTYLYIHAIILLMLKLSTYKSQCKFFLSCNYFEIWYIMVYVNIVTTPNIYTCKHTHNDICMDVVTFTAILDLLLLDSFLENSLQFYLYILQNIHMKP